MKSKSLGEVHSSVDTRKTRGFKKLLAFIGPAYLISVGYMDPGNWATDIAGGSQFGYTLIWVLLLSNLIALLLQSLSARLGLVRGLDLAQASKEAYPKFVNFSLYVLAEIAIAACDLAEVLGMAIGLNLLFGIPLLWAVLLTTLDTFLLLLLINRGMRPLEAFIVTLVGIIGITFLFEMIIAKPNASEVITGLMPNIPNGEALFIAIGIIGATVMPHNLYLHSSLVQTRKYDRSSKGIKDAIKFNNIDSTVALNLAFFVNAAILILAGAVFFKSNMHSVTDITQAHTLLAPLMGTKWASILFAVALIAAGQSSTITGTLAGQIVMEGYLDFRIQPWLRRIITRIVAITPAVLSIIYFGEHSIGLLLILSQVVLSLQLGFAVIPLIHFVSNKVKMGEFAIGAKIKFLAWLSAFLIVVLNAKLVVEQINYWINNSGYPDLVRWTAIPFMVGAALLLLFITLKPALTKVWLKSDYMTHGVTPKLALHDIYQSNKIAIAVDFSHIDNAIINRAISMGGKNAEYFLIHVVESAGAILFGNEIRDLETAHDGSALDTYKQFLIEKGFNVDLRLGFGSPKKKIPEIVNQLEADLLVIGSHGHKMFKDILLGTTVEAVRHLVKVPIVIATE